MFAHKCRGAAITTASSTEDALEELEGEQRDLDRTADWIARRSGIPYPAHPIELFNTVCKLEIGVGLTGAGWEELTHPTRRCYAIGTVLATGQVDGYLLAAPFADAGSGLAAAIDAGLRCWAVREIQSDDRIVLADELVDATEIDLAQRVLGS